MTCGLLYLSRIPRWEKPIRATAEGELCRAIFQILAWTGAGSLSLELVEKIVFDKLSHPAFSCRGGIAVSVTHAHGTAQRA